MTPGVVRRAAGLDHDELRLTASEGALVIERAAGGRVEKLHATALTDGEKLEPDAELRAAAGRFDADRHRVVLTLDPAWVLSRTLRVPRAAEADLAGVVAIEIERHIPFRAEEIYSSHAARRTSGGEGWLSIEVAVVPRRIVDPLVRALQAVGLGPDAVVGENGRRFPVSGVQERRRGGGGAFRVLATLAVVFALAAAVSPLMRLKARAVALAQTVATVAFEAEAVRDLQAEVDRLTRGATVIGRARAAAPPSLAVLGELTQLLPDGTWLYQLNAKGGEVVIEGRTQSSAALIGLIESSALFESVAYLAPVVREADGGTERFSFSVRLADD